MPIDPNDPRRCKAITSSGQCENEAVHNSSYCHRHSTGADKGAELKNYLLTNPEIAGMAAHYSQLDTVKSLIEEIGLIRSLITKRLNLIDSNADFMKACGQVNTLVLTLDKLLNSCFKLEVHLGSLLSKTAIMEIAQEIVRILTDELQELDNFESIIDRVGEQIMTTIAKQEQRK